MAEAVIEPESFLKNFAAQFEALDADSISMETEFRQLPDWSSMQSLVVIASFDWEYGATISAEELKSSKTIADLFQLVRRNMSA